MRKKKSQLEKLIFCRATVFFKLLGKTMFQVPKPTHILILGGLEAVQACAKKAIFRSLKNCFLQSLRFLQAIEENNVSGPQAYPHIDFGRIGSSPSMREKSNFSELEKLFFCKASVFFKLLRKTMFQVPKPTHICILCGLEAVQACAKNKNRNLNNCFLQNPITSRKTI